MIVATSPYASNVLQGDFADLIPSLMEGYMNGIVLIITVYWWVLHQYFETCRMNWVVNCLDLVYGCRLLGKTISVYQAVIFQFSMCIYFVAISIYGTKYI